MNEKKDLKETYFPVEKLMSIRKRLVGDLSMENFENLIATFDKGTFVPFVGAGPSEVLGVPGWKELFKKMTDSLNLKTKLRKDSEGNPDYPGAFSRLYKRNPDDFFEKLFENVKLTKSRFSGLHQTIWKVFGLCITTNFDDAFRNAYTAYKSSGTEVKLKEYCFNWVEMNNFENSIIYLHGHKDINFAIVKKEDYDYFYPSINQTNGIPILENFLKEIYYHKTIIFIGFSFSDHYISKFFLNLAKKGGEDRKHFWVTSDDCFSHKETKKKILNFYEYWKELNVFPIVYNHGYHRFVEELIEFLGENQKNKSQVKTEGAF